MTRKPVQYALEEKQAIIDRMIPPNNESVQVYVKSLAYLIQLYIHEENKLERKVTSFLEMRKPPTSGVVKISSYCFRNSYDEQINTAQKRIEKQDASEQNEIEGKFGDDKHQYRLGFFRHAFVKQVKQLFRLVCF